MDPTNHGTIAHLLEIALQAERQTEELYLGLARLFAKSEDVAAFWKSYAAEENGHARWIEGLRARTSDDRLATTADPEILSQAERSVSVWPEERLAEVKDLQQGFEIANEIESGEINIVFDFLIGYFAADESTKTFLHSQLREHIQRLMSGFPEAYKFAALRKAVPAE